MYNPVSFVFVFVIFFLISVWAFRKLLDIYDTWDFYNNKQQQPLLAQGWLIANTGYLFGYSAALIVSIVFLFHWVALPTYLVLVN